MLTGEEEDAGPWTRRFAWVTRLGVEVRHGKGEETETFEASRGRSLP